MHHSRTLLVFQGVPDILSEDPEQETKLLLLKTFWTYSEHILRKIHDCTFRPKDFLPGFFHPSSPENFSFHPLKIKNSDDLLKTELRPSKPRGLNRSA